MSAKETLQPEHTHALLILFERFGEGFLGDFLLLFLDDRVDGIDGIIRWNLCEDMFWDEQTYVRCFVEKVQCHVHVSRRQVQCKSCL